MKMIKQVQYKNIPEELKVLDNWSGWNEIEGKKVKPDKNPIDLISTYTSNTSYFPMSASCIDPLTWCSFEKASEIIEALNKNIRRNPYYKLGLQFTVVFPYVILDFDDCIDVNGTINDTVLHFIEELDTYTEISNSNAGIHCIAKTTIEFPNKGKTKETFKLLGTDLEIFTNNTFCSLTGHIYNGKTIIEDRTEVIQKIFDQYYTRKAENKIENNENYVIGNNLTIEEIIQKATTTAKNHYKFKKLFEGDYITSGYPSQSEADSAFMYELAFWCAKDTEKMDTIFRMSGLYRDKYDEIHYSDGLTYGEKLIENACEGVKAIFQPVTMKLERGKVNAKNLIKYFINNYSFFHNANKQNFVVLPTNNISRIYDIKSLEFAEYINIFLLDNFGIVASSAVLNDTKNALLAHASRSEEIDTYLRCANYNNNIYYDLCNNNLEVIEISKDGYKVVTDIPIFFEKSPIEREQLTPSGNGNISTLIQYLNLEENDLLLFIVTLISCFIPNIPHPIFMIHGQMGSGKSTLCKIIKELLDPAAANIRPLKKSEEDFRHNIMFEYFIPFDNLSSLTLDTSDALCRLITGETQIDRELYTNTGTLVYSMQKVLAINGINDVANSPDLLDRGIIFVLPTINTEKRKLLVDFENNFRKDKVEILGGIFDILSKAIKIYEKTDKLDHLPRMADFAQWGYCIAEAYNNSGKKFLEQYQQHLNSQITLLANNNIVVTTLVRFVECYTAKEITIKSQVLYHILNELVEKEGLFDIRNKGWSKDAGGLVKQINRCKPLLKEKGIDINSKHTRDGNVLVITKISDFAFTPSPFVEIDSLFEDYSEIT